MSSISFNLAVLTGRARNASLRGFVAVSMSVVAMLLPLRCFASLSDGISKPVQLNPVVQTGDVIQIGLGLIVIIAMIFGGAWLMRRFGNLPNRQNNLQVLGGISLGSRERAVILRVGEKQILVGVSPGCVSTLYVFDEPIVDVQSESKSVSFRDRLINAREQHDARGDN